MKVLKQTGTYLIRKAHNYLILWTLCLFAFVIIILTLIPVSPLYVDLGSYDTVRVLVVIVPGVGVLHFYRLYRSYQLGFAGEEHVTQELSTALSDDYSLINDVQLVAGKGSNIDHIVLGPTGIFVLETKNYSGKIACYGDSWKRIGQSPSVQARINASRVAKVIKASGIFASKYPWIQAVVVFPNKNVQLDVRRPPSKVEVLKIEKLPNYITRKPRRPSIQEVELVSKEILRVHANGGVKIQPNHPTACARVTHERNTQKTKTYTVEEIRLDYPRAYEKWTPEEDRVLTERYKEGATIHQLAKIHQRKLGAIRSRLKKLGLR